MSSNQNAHPAQKYLEQKARNLEFFSKYYPGIHDYFLNYEMKHYKVDILPQDNEVDLISDGRHVYGGRSFEYAKKEVATFLSAYDYGSKINSFRPLGRDAYTQNKRLFANAINTLYQHYYESSRGFDGYTLGDFFPLMVFMGVGLGRHIEILCNIRDIDHVLIFESDLDNFAASLYSVDWASLVTPFLEDEAKSFTFVLVPEVKDPNQLFASLWNHLIRLCPIFPVTTLFYNHLGNRLYDQLTDRINADLYVHLFSFGNLDDELNQLNNALHNFRQRIPCFSHSDLSNAGVSVCVVGSGPSLDERIEDLKQLKGKAIIISSGTALAALHSHGIVPDIQVELESDFNTYDTQKLTDDKAFMKSVKIIGAAQLNPLLFSLFGEARIFFKDDGALAHWFAEPDSLIPNATPTCTNAALALAFYIKAKKVFLFGLDYGFKDPAAHHAGGSVYYKESFEKDVKYEKSDLITVPSASGQTVFTTSFLYTSKRRLENLLFNRGASTVYNCSDGAALEYTQWVKPGVVSPLCDADSDPEKCLSLLFKSKDTVVEKPELDRQFRLISQSFRALKEKLSELVDQQVVSDKRTFTRLCSHIVLLLQNVDTKDKGLYFFVRGTLWHYLLAGYTHVYTMDESQQENYLSVWQSGLSRLLADAESRLQDVLNSDALAGQDQMVRMTIGKPLLQEAEWDYQGYSLGEPNFMMEDTDFNFLGYGFNGTRFVSYADLPDEVDS